MSEPRDTVTVDEELGRALLALQEESPTGEQPEEVHRATSVAAEAVSGPEGRTWSRRQEFQIDRLTRQLRVVQAVARSTPSESQPRWREKRARRRLGRIAERIGTRDPEVVEEAQLRYWKDLLIVEILAADDDEDLTKAETRMAGVDRIRTLEDLHRLGISTVGRPKNACPAPSA